MQRPALLGILALAIVAAVRPADMAGMQQKPSLDIHYVPTPPAVVDAMLELAAIGPGDVVYDLGSGDGRIVITAARRFGVRGVGVELDPELIKVATKGAQDAGVADRVQFRQEDIFKTNLSDATVVMLYLSPTTNLRLRERLRRELKPGTRIVSHRFDMGDWKPEQERVVGSIHVFAWTIPAR